MAVVVLFSTMSFTVNMHYCGEMLVDTAIFQQAKGCGMEMDNPTTEGCSIGKKNCCDDKQLAIEGQDELQLKIDKLAFKQHLFLASFIYSYLNAFEGLENKVTPYKRYKPPLVVKQIYKFDETYLI